MERLYRISACIHELEQRKDMPDVDSLFIHSSSKSRAKVRMASITPDPCILADRSLSKQALQDHLHETQGTQAASNCGIIEEQYGAFLTFRNVLATSLP
jgi:hypothetical protein